MNQYFLWKLGSLEHNIFPTREAVEKLTKILNEARVEGEVHLVWGPELNVDVVNTVKVKDGASEVWSCASNVDISDIDGTIKKLEEQLNVFKTFKEALDETCSSNE